MARDLRPVYTAVSEQDAKERFVEFSDVWVVKYPAITRLWENAWVEFAPFLDYPAEIRQVIYSTNAVESLHARMRRATRARGHFRSGSAGPAGTAMTSSTISVVTAQSRSSPSTSISSRGI
jgi:transposase-like protein